MRQARSYRQESDRGDPTVVESALATFNRSVRDSNEVTSMLAEAATVGHLVPPIMASSTLPEGFEVGFSVVLIDYERDTYPASSDEDRGGDRALHTSAITRIASAAGVSWDPHRSRIEAEALNYRRYMAVGSYQKFDNSIGELMDVRELDLRDGSTDVEDMVRKAKFKSKDPWPRIWQMRKHITSFAITMARTRAMRGIGVRASYKPEEIEKPFIVARLMLTGRTDDPVLHRQIALMQVQRALGVSAKILYDIPEAPALPPIEPPPIQQETKPLVCEGCGSEKDVKEMVGPTGRATHCPNPTCEDLARKNTQRAKESTGSASPQASRPKPPPAASANPPPRGDAAGVRAPTEGKASGFKIPGRNGEFAGKPIEEADVATIQFWVRTLQKRLREGETPAKFVKNDERLLAGLKAEIGRRNEEDDIPY